MSRAELALLQLANAAVTATGLAYAVMRYLLQPVDEWAVVNHPWQPQVQHLHVLATPVLVFAVGLVWAGHVAPRLRQGGRGRASGLALIAGFAAMTVSGYAIQVAVGGPWRSAWIGVHLASSAVWTGAFFLHLVRVLVERRRERATASEPLEVDLAA